MGVEPKIGVGNYPPNHPFVHRVWNHYFHHPFWGFDHYFWKHPNPSLGGGFKYFLPQLGCANRDEQMSNGWPYETTRYTYQDLPDGC